MIKILITGGQGQLAWDLIHHPLAKNFELMVPTEKELDITSAEAIQKAFTTYQPDWVINTAAYTAVDKAEQEKALAFEINAEAAGLLAQYCHQYHIKFFHVSTDYIFNGNALKAYVETDQPNPMSVYGESKLQGEQLVLKNFPGAIILRISGVFGIHGHNFVKTMLRLFQERETLQVVSDQITCPTPAYDIAEVIFKMISHKKMEPGVYHYCASSPVSWYDFASAIETLAKQKRSLKLKKIESIKSEEFKAAAKRPPYSVLNCEKIKKVFGIEQKPWKIGLQKIIEALHA